MLDQAGLGTIPHGVVIASITADSRAVGPGALFAALPGTQADGRGFIADAVARGAAAVLAPTGTVWPEGVPPCPLILHPEPRRALALLAAAYAGAQPRTVVAVTGTNGKTSTAEFLRQLYAAAGLGAASLGTLGVVARGWDAEAGLTTPDPVALAAILRASPTREWRPPPSRRRRTGSTSSGWMACAFPPPASAI